MPRLMSVSHTKESVRARTKTVTRRLGWWEDKKGRRLLKPGDRLTLCEKVMGRKAGDPLVRICDVEVVHVHRERLWDITDAEIRREGVPLNAGFDEFYNDTGLPTPDAWVRWFCESMGCRPDDFVTRIEWRYLEEGA